MNIFPLRYRAEFPFGSVFRDLERVMRDYDDAFLGATASPMPTFDMHQDDDAYHVTAELPGFTEKDIKLDVHQGVITVSGKRAVNVPEGFRASHRERSVVKFSRSLRLPDQVDAERVKANLKDGILAVELPKRPEVKPRQIPIQAG
jgi:HSP20 family protein